MSAIRLKYHEQLKDPRWQKRRLKVMEYAHWRCQVCGAKEITLHCHHSYYLRGKLPWQYPDGAIICVCENCHTLIHNRETMSVKPTSSKPEISKETSEAPVSFEEAVRQFAEMKRNLEAKK